MRPVIAIIGTTCSGKTNTAITLANQYNGEVISADSRQVYTGLDIGTGKVTKEEMDGVPHHLIDVVEPHQQYSVQTYKTDGLACIEDIKKRDHLPIIAGGTGQYVDALIYTQTIPEVPPNEALRKELETKNTDELFSLLQQEDPERAATIESKNKRRLVRALEIVRELGSVPKQTPPIPRFNHLIIGLSVPPDTLKERIHARLLERLNHGMIEEVKDLHASGLSWERCEELGLEYRYIKRHLTGDLSYDEMVEQLERAIHKYAKRQLTWWRHRNDVTWYAFDDIRGISECVRNHLTPHQDRA